MFNPFREKKNVRVGKRGEELPETYEGLPDSYRPNGLCPRCNKQSSFDVKGSLPVTYDSSYIALDNDKFEQKLIDRASILICRNCKQGVAVIEEEWVGDYPMKQAKQGGTVSYRGIHWWPIPEANLSSDIPSEIAAVVAEAAGAIYANCPRASSVMSRRGLEAICVDKGESSGTLSDRLDSLKNKGILQPTLSDWAKEVRIIGNIGAHFDPIQTISLEDARQLLSFVKEILKYLYELPAELSRRRNKQR